jgi:hypothetical protein
LPLLYVGHNISSVQLLGSVSLVQACWITACNASTRLGPPFFNSAAAIESTPAALLFFRCFSAPFIDSWLGKSMSTPSSLKSTGRVGCSHAGCACLSLADVRFPSQLLRSRLPSQTLRDELGRLRMPAPAVQKIDPWPPRSHFFCFLFRNKDFFPRTEN